jgi:hypothetical protein
MRRAGLNSGLGGRRACKCLWTTNPAPKGFLVEGETRVNGYKGWLMSAQSDAMRQAGFRTVQGGAIDGGTCKKKKSST